MSKYIAGFMLWAVAIAEIYFGDESEDATWSAFARRDVIERYKRNT